MARADCSWCGGTGWRLVDRVDANETAQRTIERRNAPMGASTAQPRLTWAVPCDCTGADRAAQILAKVQIPRRYEHCDFENFDTDPWEGFSQSPVWNRSLAQARLVAEAFARNYPAGGETGLLLMGPCGVGKTHLAVSIVRQLALRGHAARFCDYRELLKQIQASYDPDHPVSEMGVLEPVLNTEVLLIDDLGVGKPSAWVLDTIGHILGKRYNEKRVTLLTTSYTDGAESPAETSRLPSGQIVPASREETLAERLGQRVRSRLYEMCRTVEIASLDYRREIRNARVYP